jgi:hypothetical protein
MPQAQIKSSPLARVPGFNGLRTKTKCHRTLYNLRRGMQYASKNCPDGTATCPHSNAHDVRCKRSEPIKGILVTNDTEKATAREEREPVEEVS